MFSENSLGNKTSVCVCAHKSTRAPHLKGWRGEKTQRRCIPGEMFLSTFFLSALLLHGKSVCSRFSFLVKLFSRQTYKPQALARHRPCSVGGTQMGFNLLPVIFVCLFVCAGALKAKQTPETKRGVGGWAGEGGRRKTSSV